jgi:hypothetical protein
MAGEGVSSILSEVVISGLYISPNTMPNQGLSSSLGKLTTNHHDSDIPSPHTMTDEGHSSILSEAVLLAPSSTSERTFTPFPRLPIESKYLILYLRGT